MAMPSPLAHTRLQKLPRHISSQAMPSSPHTSIAASLGPHLSPCPRVPCKGVLFRALSLVKVE